MSFAYKRFFFPIIGQAVLPGGEVSGEKPLVSRDDEVHAQSRQSGAQADAAGRASAQ